MKPSVSLAKTAIFIAVAQAAPISAFAFERDVSNITELRTAITDANNAAGPDTINLTADINATDSSVSSGNAVPFIHSEMTINGNGFAIRRVVPNDTDPANQFRIMAVFSPGSLPNSGKLTLNDITLEGGFLPNNRGGGLYVEPGTTAFLSNSTITGNSVGVSSSYVSKGGGIYAKGTITLLNCEVSNNGSYAGRAGIFIAADGFATIRGSTVSGHPKDGIALGDNAELHLTESRVSNNNGTGVSAGNNSTVTITASTLEGNDSIGLIGSNTTTVFLHDSTLTRNGGRGVYFGGSSLTVSNSTFSNNSGFGLVIGSSSNVNMNNSTVTDHLQGGILITGFAQVILNNSLISDSGPVGDCNVYGGMVSPDTASIIEDGSCAAARSGDPGLLPLADNGGPTLTHALRPDSIARNTGVISGATGVLQNCTSRDQRGVVRNSGDQRCDVGAVESTQSTNLFVIPLPQKKLVVIPL